MAISKVTGSTGSASSGTTVTAGSISVNSGDLVVLVCSLLPTSATVTWSKSAGTATIGTPDTNIVKTNGNAHLVVSWVSVTGTGTLTLRATSSATIVNALILVEAYRGQSGISPLSANASGTAVDVTASLTTIYTNSWCVLCATSVQSAALTAGTNTTLEQAVQSNIGGTANDLAGFIGSNESALSINTNEALHCTQANSSNAWAAIILEIALGFTINTTAGIVSSAGKVASSLKSASAAIAGAKSIQVSKAASASIAETISLFTTGMTKSRTETGSAHATVIASSPKSINESAASTFTVRASSVKSETSSISVTVSAVVGGSSGSVLWPDASSLLWPDSSAMFWSEASESAAASIASTFTVLASSVRAGSGHIGAVGTAVITALTKNLSESIGATGTAVVTTNSKSVSESVSATATKVASSLRVGSGAITSTLTLSTLGAINWPDGDGMRWPDNLDYVYWLTPNPTFGFGTGHVSTAVSFVASSLTSRSGSIGATAVAAIFSATDVSWPDGTSVLFPDASAMTWPIPPGPNTSGIFVIQGLGW